MGKLLKEAAIDERFNVQIRKVQDAIDKLREIVKDSKSDRMTRLVTSQRLALRHAAEDFKKLHDEA